MIVESLEVGAFAENCYLVACDETRESVVIDPGDEVDRIADMVRKLQLKVRLILLTHAHLDHVKEVNAFNKELAVPVWMHKEDRFLLDNLPVQAASFGMTTSGVPAIERYLVEGDTIDVGNLVLRVLHTPVHSPGSISFVTENCAFVGDVLFSGSIGRTDLPGGDMDTLLASIESKLLPLGDATRVYPGHGPMTTIGQERQFNPFLGNHHRPNYEK